jgi:hypothetical protein
VRAARPHPILSAALSPPEPRATATLSVCCLTRGPTALVAAQLAELRGVADEIVVALDMSVDAQLAQPLAELADVLVYYPYAEPVDRPVGWIHSLCTRDWILWLDDDEIASVALIGQLRSLVGSPEVTHYWLPRRWLWRDASTVLDGHPWTPDYQLRLVENDPRLLWFPGITHRPIEALGPHRFVEAPLYHTDLLLNPVESRRAKVRRYESAAPGSRVAGLPVNAAFYLPEDRPSLRTAPVAAEDSETIQRLLALDPWPQRVPPRRTLRTATRAEIDSHWHGAPVGEALYQARLSIPDEIDPFSAGESRGVMVRVENRGSHVWPPGSLGWPVIRLMYRWLTEDGRVVVPHGLRTTLPQPLAPTLSLLVPVLVLAPESEGRYVLAFEVVHEHVREFGCDAAVAVEVRRTRRLAIMGDHKSLAAAAAAILAEVAPEVVPLLLVAEPADAPHPGYPAALDARSYVLEGVAVADAAFGARLGTLGRVGALLSDALLVRCGRQPRLAAPSGVAFLDTLRAADGLLVVGDVALRGSLGGLEAWQRGAAILAAAALGLDVVVASEGNGGGTLPGWLAPAVSAVVAPQAGRDLNDVLPDAVRTAVERVG